MSRTKAVAAAALLVVALGGVPVPAVESAPATELQPGTGGAVEPRSAVEEATAALARGELAAARAGFEQAVVEAPSSVEAWLGLTAAAESAGDTVRAVAAARAAARLAPERAAVQLALGRALLQAERTAEAQVALERCRRAGGQGGRQGAAAAAQCSLLGALQLREEGRNAEAIALLEEALVVADGPQAATLATELAWLLLGADRPEEALATVDAALENASDDGDLVLTRALAVGASRRGEARAAALDEFERAVALGVSNVYRARVEWARLAGELGRWTVAADQLRRAAELEDDDPQLHFRLATALRQLGQTAAAAASLDRYRELEGERTERARAARELGTAVNEAQQLANDDRLDEAWARLDSLGPEADAATRVWTLRAKLLFASGRAEDARLAAGRALTLDPRDAEAAYLLAGFAFAAERYDESLAAVDVLVTLEPEFGEGWALMGSALARLVRLDEAVVAFEKALALGFDSVALRRDYAAVLSDLGRPDDSRRQLEALRALAERG